MKPFVQKLPLEFRTSFVARTYTTPYFETTWHQHKEIELILQLRGNGMCFIGDYMGNFKAGDIFLIGSNVPHEFKKEHSELECSVMVIHFDKDVWGSEFLQLPESAEIQRLLHHSTLAVKISANDHPSLEAAITALETASGFERFTLLAQCLLYLSRDENKETLGWTSGSDVSIFENDKVNKIYEYTISHFQEPVALATVANIANMSVSAFCRYFKRNTKKTYIDFLNEMRIGHACHLLINSDKTILQIAFDSGFNTIANFNKQFLKIKHMKPSVFRKQFDPIS